MNKRIAFKKMSPYRVYKRETAAQIKAEFPLMSNEERSQIVKERWRTISDQLKSVYVALARIEQEKLQHDAVQLFYKERIETARKHAGMKSRGPLAAIDEESSDKSSCERKLGNITVSTEITRSSKISPVSSDGPTPQSLYD
jgi:hypothetical protein